MNLLTIKNLNKSFTDKVLFKDADFSLETGDKVGIVGVNGTGKSTLLRIIAGIEEPDSGEYIKGNHVVINYLPQNPEFQKNMSIYDYVISVNSESGSNYDIEGEAKTILNHLGFTDYSVTLEHLSGGQKKKVALAGALLSKNEVLILDEPTNHLDNYMTEWLESWLKVYKGALIMVTHDRYFLDLVCNRIVEIDKGHLYSYQENYEGFLALKLQREEMALSTQKKHQNILRKEIAWMQRGARARSTKQKAHIQRYEALRDEEKIVIDGQVEIEALASRLGNKTIELYNLTKSYGEKKLFSDLTFTFLRDDKVGILGPNGCGKSTLMKVILGQVQSDSGHVEIGDTVNIGYYAQECDAMDPSLRAIDYIKETAEFIRTDNGYISASQLMERFLFDKTLQYQRIEKLSGGEKRRLYLCKVLITAPNVLILDEPTNDLDISTLQVLEDYLDSFPGIIIAVSHDRYFLDRVVGRMLTFEENGLVRLYNGSYTEYFMEKKEVLGLDSPKKSQADTGDDSTGQISSGALAYQQQKAAKTKLKFSYKEQREYDTIEADIEELEKKIADLERQLSDPKIASDYYKLNELTKEKETLEQAHEEKMERFLYLEDLAEQIKNQQ